MLRFDYSLLRPALGKNRFYFLPLSTIIQILNLIQMPPVYEKNLIQQSVLIGFNKIFQKQIKSIQEYLQNQKFIQISIQAKEYVKKIFQDLLHFQKFRQNPQTYYMNTPIFPSMIQMPLINHIISPPLIKPENISNSQIQNNQANQIYNNKNVNQKFSNLPPAFLHPNYSNYLRQIGQISQIYDNKPIYKNFSQEKQKNIPIFEQPNQNIQLRQQSQKQNLNKNKLIKKQKNKKKQKKQIKKDLQTSKFIVKKIFRSIGCQTQVILIGKKIELFKKKSQKDLKNYIQQNNVNQKKHVQAYNQQKHSDQQKGLSRYLSQILDRLNFSQKNLQNAIDYYELKNQINNFNKEYLPNNYFTKQQYDDLKKKLITSKFSKCLCTGRKQNQQYFSCKHCKHYYHFSCLNQKINKNIQKICLFCILQRNDHFRQTKQSILQQIISDKEQFQVIKDFKSYQYYCLQRHRCFNIQLRFLKIKQDNHFKYSQWPKNLKIQLINMKQDQQKFKVQINQTQIANNCLKIITNKIFSQTTALSGDLKFKIKFIYPQNMYNQNQIKQKYIFGVYFTNSLSLQQLFIKLLKNGITNNQKYIQNLFKIKDQTDIIINQIVCHLEDPFTKNTIQTPVRGIDCQHGQCFDLKNYLILLESKFHRNWKCPYCRKTIDIFMFDIQQLKLIKKSIQMSSLPSMVIYKSQGKMILKVASIDSQSDSQDILIRKRPKKHDNKQKIGQKQIQINNESFEQNKRNQQQIVENNQCVQNNNNKKPINQEEQIIQNNESKQEQKNKKRFKIKKDKQNLQKQLPNKNIQQKLD